MRIKSVEITGFEGVAEKAQFNLETSSFSQVLPNKEKFPILFYKVVFGIIFGLSDQQKKKLRSGNKKIRTFTGLIKIQVDNDEYSIERDFETDFVAYVSLNGSRMRTIYQGKDIVKNGSHKAYLSTIKNYVPELISSINLVFKQIEQINSKDKVERSKEKIETTETNHSNIYFLHPENQEPVKKEAKLSLENYPYLFYEIFNKAQDAIFLWKLNQDLTPGICIEANRAACELTGYSLNELRTKTFLDLKPKLEKERIRELTKQLIEKGQLSVETVNLTKDGKEVFVEINAHSFLIENQRVILSVTRDISLKKHFDHSSGLSSKTFFQ